MKTRKTITAVTTIIMLCLLIHATAFAGTGKLNPGEVVTGTFMDENQVFEYNLELTSSGKLDIDVHNDVEDSISFSIDGSDFNMADYIETGDESYSYELAPGQYLIRLKSYKAGNFSMTTHFASVGETYTQDNNTINSIRKKKALSFNKKVTGHIAWNDHTNWYKIVLPSSGRLNLAIHSEIGEIVYELRDAGEEYISEKYIGKGDDETALHLTAGTYYLRFGQVDDYGVYTFKTAFKDAGETYSYENDSVNLVRSKKTIPFASVIRGQFALNDYVDCYKVSIPKTGKYSIAVTGYVDTVIFDIRDKNDNYEEEFFHQKGTGTYKVKLKEGLHYFLFKHNSGYGNYCFRLMPTGVSISKLAKGTGSMKLKWAKGSGNGYQVQYSTDKNFRKNCKTKIIKNAGTTSASIKKLKSGKIYYARIRTYVLSEGRKIWSAWSKSRKVRTK